jgi:ribonuclease BN (tRNA processing enzyme)
LGRSGWRATCCPTTSPTRAYGWPRPRSPSAYTGDSGPTPVLAELGRNADLYITEATYREGSAGPHLMTASEAGVWASRAGARRLMLTHFWPGSDRAAWIAEARRSFRGEVLAAEEGRTVPL